MTQDPGLASWLQLTLTPGLGAAALRGLLKQFGLPHEVLARRRAELAALRARRARSSARFRCGARGGVDGAGMG